MAQSEWFGDLRGNGLRVAIEQVGIETAQQARDRLADRAGPDDADGGTDDRASVQHGSPAGEAVAHAAVPAGDVAGQADQQAHRELGGRLGEEILDPGHDDAPVGAGLQVDVVAALQHPGDHAQAWAAVEEIGINLVRHEHHQRVRRCRPAPQLCRRKAVVVLVGYDIAGAAEQLEDLRMHPVRDHHDRTRHANRLRSSPPRPSTTVTVTRMTISSAATSSYWSVRSAAISSKPIPPAPTTPTTTDARKLYSQR